MGSKASISRQKTSARHNFRDGSMNSTNMKKSDHKHWHSILKFLFTQYFPFSFFMLKEVAIEYLEKIFQHTCSWWQNMYCKYKAYSIYNTFDTLIKFIKNVMVNLAGQERQIVYYSTRFCMQKYLKVACT